MTHKKSCLKQLQGCISHLYRYYLCRKLVKIVWWSVQHMAEGVQLIWPWCQRPQRPLSWETIVERGDFYGALSNVWAEVGAPEGATFVPPLIQADVYALNYTLEPFISSGNRNISKVSNLCLLGLFLGSYCSSYWHIGSIKPGVWVCLQWEQHLGRSDVF